MNEVLHQTPWGAPNFVDAKLWDTRLSVRGVQQAQQLNFQLSNKEENFKAPVDVRQISLLVASPLKRTLQTAEYTFNGQIEDKIPKLAHPLFRERLYMSPEVGKQKHELLVEHPNWDYSHVPENTNWWYEHKTKDDEQSYKEWRPKGEYCCPGEPDDIFRSRLREMREWLLSRPEECIAVVTHWGVIRGLTGKSANNCEVSVVSVCDLLEEPFVDP